jgi:hypothetical protein
MKMSYPQGEKPADLPVQAPTKYELWKLLDVSGIDGIFGPRRKKHGGT